MVPHSFHIIFSSEPDSRINLAVNNVFDNFSYFLKFNKYAFANVEIKIGPDGNNDFSLSNLFVQNILNQEFHHEVWFEKEALIIENKEADYIGTCFYMINSLQEYASADLDSLGRFSYSNTYQNKFNIPEKNLVLDYFQEMAKIIFGQLIPLQQSQYILSHDIDFVHSSWKNKLKNDLAKLNLGSAIKGFLKHLKGKDDWQNIEQIFEAEHKYSIQSIFFWIVVKGKTRFGKIRNADYSIDEKYIQHCLNKIENSTNHQNGLHKSISDLSLNDEINKLPPTKLNRYHYLKFNLAKDFALLSASSIEADYSLGFSEKIGFRNSYGLPYKPMNPATMKYYNFIEYPLHIMDSSLYYYMGLKDQKEMIARLDSFIEQNQKSSVIGILWHNNFYNATHYEKLLSSIKDKLGVYPE